MAAVEVTYPKSPLSALAPSPQAGSPTAYKVKGSSSSSMYSMGSASHKSRAACFFITLVVAFLIAILILFIWKPDRILNADGTINNGMLVGYSILFALLIAGIATLLC